MGGVTSRRKGLPALSGRSRIGARTERSLDNCQAARVALSEPRGATRLGMAQRGGGADILHLISTPRNLLESPNQR